MWHGLPRERFEWHPSIDYSKCTGCGLCFVTCGHDVFHWDRKSGKPVVAKPGDCVMGCTTCGKLCPAEAITFPSDAREFIQGVLREHGATVFKSAREELEERLSKYPFLAERREPSAEPSPAFKAWHGLDRKEIPWYPSLDEGKCIGCGLCVVTCGQARLVWGFDRERRKAVLLQPYNCMVGCNNCEVNCPRSAISFPDARVVRDAASRIDPSVLRAEVEEKLRKKPHLAIG
ncbi:4Fe-4S dicluster domain-containing protein [Infirmifilum sp. NZ]|uniref:4Fe-4S dicluster domain-containing protein n=1 Tax=Infirmifilum sp. NZ TaxID=2926850 RepID=UPI0027A48129|nr:ferredoxin family protein [Infirmifilum sp. NZ]UNQ73803.1 4Fe-4S binding protein [Infirmifilum sp. NZ]